MSLSLKDHPPNGSRDLPDSVIFGRSAGMQLVRRNIEKIAATNIPVLIQGETGTGKELLALAIHRCCGGTAQNFVKVTCPALPDALSGKGLDESIGKVTFFLDRVAELDAALQLKLLQLLKEEPLDRNNQEESHVGNVRLICSTSRVLEDEVEAGSFRRDLFDRISGFLICIPSLRQRPEDIPALVDYLLKFHEERNKTQCRAISGELMELMQRYHWPGNIRELENLIRRYVILGSEQVIGSELLSKVPTEFQSEQFAGGSISLKKLTRQAAREVERRIILKALEISGWNRKVAARSLNISYRALLYKIKQGGMPPKRTASSRIPNPVSSSD